MVRTQAQSPSRPSDESTQQPSLNRPERKLRKRIEFPGDVRQGKPLEPRKRRRAADVVPDPAGKPIGRERQSPEPAGKEQNHEDQKANSDGKPAHPEAQLHSTDVVVRKQGATDVVAQGERHVVLKRDSSLLKLTYEEYLEVYERVEAAWRLRKVEDLFLSSKTQQ